MMDQLHQFILNDGEYRGTIVHLKTAYQQIIQLHHYPAAIGQLLGEALAAISLVGHNIKQQGQLSLQLQGNDPIQLLVVETNDQHEIRGLVQWRDNLLLQAPLILSEGQLALTLTPQKGERHQGIVPIIKGTLAESLSHYFSQSEQIFSRVILMANETQACGLFVQKMPDFTDSDFRLSSLEAHLLLNTIQAHELLNDSAEVLLQKLFYEHDVRLLETAHIQFHCSCSHAKMLDAVRLLGYDDALDLLLTHKTVTITCEFCNHHYDFDKNAVNDLFQTMIN